MTPRTTESIHSAGALLIGADWALAHGNIATLAHVSELLAERTSASLRGDLLDLAELCNRDVDLAALRWPRLREQVCDELCSS